MDTTLLKNLLKDLECPICGDYMHPPIRQCIMGHSFCNGCFNRTLICGECRQPKSSGRSYALESLHSKLHFPCKNRDDGCTFASPGVSIKKHEESCLFGFKACPLRMIDDCQWMGQPKNIVVHCMERHPTNVYTSRLQKLRFENFALQDSGKSACHVLFAVFNELFRCSWEMDFANELMKWCVYHLGRARYSKQYAYEIGFAREGENANDRWLRAPCIPAGENNGEIDDEDCLIVHSDVLKKYCVGNDLTYTITIIDTDYVFFS